MASLPLSLGRSSLTKQRHYTLLTNKSGHDSCINSSALNTSYIEYFPDVIYGCVKFSESVIIEQTFLGGGYRA